MAGAFQVIRDDGKALNASVEYVIDEDGLNGLVIHSRSGGLQGERQGRNSEYAIALKLILDRLQRQPDTQLRVYLASSDARKLWAPEERLLQVDGQVSFNLSHLDMDVLRRGLGNAMGKKKAAQTKHVGGNNTKRILLVADRTAEGWEQIVFGGFPHQPRAFDKAPAFTNIPEGITRQHILDAMTAIDLFEPHMFGPSTDFDVFHANKRYPPKAVVGLAAKAILGYALRPVDFGGGEDTRCFQVLKSNGFEVIQRTNPLDDSKLRGDPKSKRPSPRKNTLSFSGFCESLGTPLKNRANRWCGYDPVRGIAVFTIWADRLHGDRYPLWDDARRSDDTRAGARELKQVIQAVMSAGHKAYGIRSEARILGAATRERGYFDEDQLLVLGLENDGANVIAKVLGTVPAIDVAGGRLGPLAVFESAIDDLGSPPPGNFAPERRASHGGTGYRRDPEVRDFVIRRAKGVCEYCGSAGFKMADGSPYLEAHHVIALSALGPDTVNNVIALCPSHHREAHYGQRAAILENEFLIKLQEIAPR